MYSSMKKSIVEWYFFVDGFMDWMYDEFPEPMRDCFTRELLINTINHLYEEYQHNRAEFIYKMTEIIPKVTEEDVIYWINK